MRVTSSSFPIPIGSRLCAQRSGSARNCRRLVDAGTLGGFDTPARFLPSLESQKARQQALPPPAELAARLQRGDSRPSASAGAPAPFSRRRGGWPGTLVRSTRADLDGTSFALATDALLMQRGGRWSALLPLKAAQRGTAACRRQSTRSRYARRWPKLEQGNVLLVDLKGETDRLYAGYLGDAIYLSLAGFAVIVGLLWLALRSPVRVLRVVGPLVAAVVVVIAAHALSGNQPQHPPPRGHAADRGGRIQLCAVLRSARRREGHGSGGDAGVARARLHRPP